MAKLAIKGHATKGDEVIEILGILGGSNAFGHIGNNPRAIYYIDETYKNFITCSDTKKVCECVIFTLEEFLEKFPYKVGDKVSSKYLKNYEVSKMEWESANNRVIYKLQGMGWYSADELQPYKEETMKDIIKIDIPKGYEFAGVDDDNQQVVFEKIGYHYPKTYEECCEVLGIEEDLWFVYEDIDGNHINPACISNYRIRNLDLYHNFEKLLLCRDAYWKIVGNWKPDFANYEEKFIIAYVYGKVYTTTVTNYNRVLVFPTEEMRDAFYENFKELINETKELL